MIETSESTAALDAALAKAQGEIEVAIKDKLNPAFRSKYADLHAVMEAARPALAKNGVSVTQWPIHSEDGRVHMVTRVAHGGEWIRAHFSIPVGKQDAHGYGSAISYLRRFCAAAALGIVTGDVEDDDGNLASRNPAPAVPEPAAELVARAKAAAERGTGAYAEFWKSLPAPDRTAIGPNRHADFKSVAREVDEAPA